MKVVELVWKLKTTPVPPYSFEYTVLRTGTDKWWKTPFEHRSTRTLWSALVYHEGVVGVKLHDSGTVEEPLLEVEVFSDGDVQADFTPQIRSAVGADEDTTEFYRLAENYSFLKTAKNHFYGLKACKEDDYTLFCNILRCLLFRRASHQKGRAMRDALIQHFGEHVHFDGRDILFWPLPRTLVHAGEASLREVCKLGFRAPYIYALAEAFVSHQFPPTETLRAMTVEEALSQLEKLKGVGPQTARLCVPQPLFPVTEWNAPFFSKLLFGDEFHSKEQVAAFAQAEFGHWQGYAFEYIMRDKETLKKEEFF